MPYTSELTGVKNASLALGRSCSERAKRTLFLAKSARTFNALYFRHKRAEQLVVTRRPCSDFTDMLRRLINCRIIIIIIIITLGGMDATGQGGLPSLVLVLLCGMTRQTWLNALLLRRRE